VPIAPGSTYYGYAEVDFLMFSIDAITGEVESFEHVDFDAPVTTITLDSMQFTILDYTGMAAEVGPVDLPQSYHLSLEEVAPLIAVAVEEAYSVSLDGLSIRLWFSLGDSGFPDTWGGFVFDGDEPVNGSEAFHITIDARTGELIGEVEDVRDWSEVGAPSDPDLPELLGVVE
jgi:hypothetical protein